MTAVFACSQKTPDLTISRKDTENLRRSAGNPAFSSIRFHQWAIAPAMNLPKVRLPRKTPPKTLMK